MYIDAETLITISAVLAALGGIGGGAEHNAQGDTHHQGGDGSNQNFHGGTYSSSSWAACLLPGGLPAGVGNGYHGATGKRRRGGMTKTELIAELTDICIRQAEIIKAQAYVLEQLGAQVQEEEALAAQNRLREMGCWED